MTKAELPSRADYRKALETITDHTGWNIIRAFTDSETSMQPEFVTPAETTLFLKPLTYILPLSWIPFGVRQWAGQDGEQKFVEEATKLMKTHTS